VEPLAQEVEVLVVQQELCPGGRVYALDAQHVVDVRVGVRDEFDLDSHVPRQREDLLRLVARVDADGLAGAPVPHDPAVLLEHAHDNAADHQLTRNFHGSIRQQAGANRQQERWPLAP
jgi:hypothetical protein